MPPQWKTNGPQGDLPKACIPQDTVINLGLVVVDSNNAPHEGDKFRRGYITLAFLGANSLVAGGGGGGQK